MSILPDTFSLKAAAIAGLVALVLGIGGGIYLAHLYYDPRLTLEVQKSSRLQDDVDTQNHAIEDLQAKGAAREAAAASAVEAARKDAAKYQTRAQQILASQKPAGKTDCEAAEDLIAKELGK